MNLANALFGTGAPRRRRWHAAAAVLATAAVAGTTAGQATAAEPKRGGTLTVALETDFRGFDAIKGRFLGASAASAATAFMEPLLRFDAEGNRQLVLATSVTASDDLVTYTLGIRQGVLFHDGGPLTAAAVAGHFSRILDPNNKFATASAIAPIVSAEAVSDQAVRFTLKHPWLPFQTTIAGYWMGSLIPSPAAVAADKQNREPVGTGPYRFVEWRGGDRLIVERNPDYWAADERGFLDRVVFRILPDQQTRFAALQSGEVDIIWTDRANSVLKAQKDPDIAVHSAEGSGGGIWVMNTSSPPLDDPRVRQAIAHSYDQELIIRSVGKGLWPFITDAYNARIPVDCGVSNYRVPDFDKAKALLADYGKPVEIEMIHTTTPRGREYGEIIQQLLKKVGIKVKLAPVDQLQLRQRVYTGNYQLSGWRIMDYSDQGPQLLAFLHSKSGYNLTRYFNDEMDQQLIAQRTATTPENRAVALCKIATMINDDAPFLWGSGFRHFALAKPSVKGIAALQGSLINVAAAWLDQ